MNPDPDWNDISRQLDPDLFDLTEKPSGSPRKASDLTVEICPVYHARDLVMLWHSRLPNVQKGPWMHAFRAHWNGYTYGVALWHNPSARNLPQQWVELRRMAVAEDAPHCTASRMLGQMARWFRVNKPECDRLVSYQDAEVHTGTIYSAAGWTRAYYSKPRERQRKGYSRPGHPGREYRTGINGMAADQAGKWRWELALFEGKTSTEKSA
jgi:hypothetical protein